MNVNLLPWRESQNKKQRRFLLSCLLFSTFATIITCAYLHIQNSLVIHQQDRTLSQLERKISQNNILHQKNVSTNLRTLEQQKLASFVVEQISLHHQLCQFLFNLANTLPTSIYLTSIERKDRRLKFSGKADSHISLAMFLKALNESLKTHQAELSETHDSHNHNDEMDFQMAYTL